MKININKVKETLMGILFILIVASTGIQPAEAAKISCEHLYTNNDDWYEDPPEAAYVNIEVFNNLNVIEVDFGGLKSTLEKVPSTSLVAEAIEGVDSINDLWHAGNERTDMYFMNFTENQRGNELNMIIISDYGHGYPRHSEQWYICR